MDLAEKKKEKIPNVEDLVFIILLFGTYFTSFYNYLLFHAIGELFSISIATATFIIMWNARENIDNTFYLIIGVSYFFASIFDLIHTLGYAGMNIFVGYDSNLPTSLWISARYLQAISILIASILINKKFNQKTLMVIYTISTITLVVLIFLGLFPVCYIEGVGLTPFKVISEYIIDSILFISIFVLYFHRKLFTKKIFMLFILSIISTMISEFAFTFYVSVYGFSNLIGHLLKVVAFYFVYRGIIAIGLRNPQNLLYRRLKQSQEKYSHLFHFAPIGIGIADLNGNLISYNKKLKEILGFDENDLNKFNVKSTYKDPVQREKFLKQLKENGYITNFEVNLLKKNGKSFKALVNSTIVNMENENVILSSIQDISESRRLQSEASQILNASLPLRVLNNKGYIIQVNDTYSKLFKTPKEKIIGEKCCKITPVQFCHTELCSIRQLEKGEKKFVEYEKEYTLPNGQNIVYMVQSVPFTDLNGKNIGIIQNFTEITKRKEAERLIKDLAKFPSETPNPIFRATKDKVIYANKIAKKLLNLAKGSLIPNDFDETVRKVFDEKKKVELEVEIEHRYYLFIIYPVEDENYVNVYGIDITGKKEADRKIKQFISIASHELRTPISVLLQSIENLTKYKDQTTEAQKEQLINAISRNAKLLAELTEYLLLISKVEEGKLMLDFKQSKPFDLIQNILYMMEPIQKRKNISIDTIVDDKIELIGDPVKISQVFRIIIDNTLKFSKNDTNIIITAIDKYTGQYNPEERDGVLLQFIDQGIGIAERELEHIFERFYRGEGAKNIPGTGLGLSIAKDLVEAHEGKIYIKSILGKGSTFSIFLPRIKVRD